MVDRIKNIINLTKIFFKNSVQNPNLIDQKTNKINKRSMTVWLLIIIMITLTYFSYYILQELYEINQVALFLNALLLILIIGLIFQVTIVCTNVYYFSQDIELILPLPIKPVDILIAKFCSILINTYFFEIIFILFPLIIYGIFTYAGVLYYIYLLILLLIFPILPALIVSTIMMFLMKFSKFIKNKDIFQVIITFLFMFIIFYVEFYVIKNIIIQSDGTIITEETEAIEQLNNFYGKLENINACFLQINPSIKLLNNSKNLTGLFNLFKIIFLDLIFFIIFIFIGRITYLKNILKNNNFNTAKKIKKINLNKKCKKRNKGYSYIIKEFKMLFKNPIFFMQCIFPTLIIIITLIIIGIFVLPNIKAFINSELINDESLEFGFNTICIILCGIQIIFTFSNISITSISREGKNAIFMKFIPIDLYKQIIYKSMPQIIINFIFIFILNILIYLILPNINLIYYLYIFIIANILNIFNSILMVIVDLKDPNLNWSAEYEVISQNNKKLYQYVLTIAIILILTYFSNLFYDLNINLSCILIIFILLFILIIFNIIINKNKNKIKLFKNINN